LSLGFLLLGHALFFAPHKGPDFIRLDVFTGKAYQGFVLVLRTRFASVTEQLYGGVLGHPSKAAGGTDRITLYKTMKDLCALLAA